MSIIMHVPTDSRRERYEHSICIGFITILLYNGPIINSQGGVCDEEWVFFSREIKVAVLLQMNNQCFLLQILPKIQIIYFCIFQVNLISLKQFFILSNRMMKIMHVVSFNFLFRLPFEYMHFFVNNLMNNGVHK